jgi:hypothetical protein
MMQIFLRCWIPIWVQIMSGQQAPAPPEGLLNLSLQPSGLPERHRPLLQSGDGKGRNKKAIWETQMAFFEYNCKLPQLLFICCGNVPHKSGDLIHNPGSHLPSAGNFPQKSSTSE